MQNLAGVNGCDEVIRTELTIAGCLIESAKTHKSEVPYSLIGRVGNWELIRAWRYWIAVPVEGKHGLPLSIASIMHEKQYPKEKFEKCNIENYGSVIRSAGHCASPHPREWAIPSKDDMVKLGIERKTYGELATFLNEKDRGIERYVESYHIDTQEGLNEFVLTIKAITEFTVPPIELGRTSEEQYRMLMQLGFPNNPNSKNPTPTLAFVLKWLREFKKIDICVNKVLATHHPDFGLYKAIILINNYMRTDIELPGYTKFEISESSGIDFALNFLSSKK